jgi:Fe-S cluster assembly protein SufD
MNLQEAFQKFNQIQKAQGPWGKIRQNGFRYFEKHGLPTKTDEAWHYTSLKALPVEQLLPQVSQAKVNSKKIQSQIAKYLNSDFFNLVFCNGILIPELSDLQKLKKIKLTELQKIHQTSVLSVIRKARTLAAPLRQDAMEALNSAFAWDGIAIEVPADMNLAKPLQVIYFQDSEKASYPKTLLKLSEGAKLSLIETFIGGNQASLCNPVTEVVVGESAKLEYIRVQAQGSQSTHVGCTRIFLMRNAVLESLSYATGAALNRHNLDIYCLGEGAFAQVHGLTVGAEAQHHDNHTLIAHVVGHCTTHQLYKSILDDKSRAIFTGRVQIRPQAQKASSEQLNKNLLLSSQAEADSKPELGIFADDVKATHGSTIGQLNAEELFYFMSRAIPKEQAIQMLSFGFVKDLLDRISNKSIRTWLTAHLEQKDESHG